MSIKRWATRKDSVQKDIIAALEAVNCEVWVIEQPIDLLTHYRGRWLPLECKTPQKNGKPRKRNDQEAQATLIERTRIPVVTTPVEALKAVGAIYMSTVRACWGLVLAIALIVLWFWYGVSNL